MSERSLWMSLREEVLQEVTQYHLQKNKPLEITISYGEKTTTIQGVLDGIKALLQIKGNAEEVLGQCTDSPECRRRRRSQASCIYMGIQGNRQRFYFYFYKFIVKDNVE